MDGSSATQMRVAPLNVEVFNFSLLEGCKTSPTQSVANSPVELRKYISERKQLFVRVVSTGGDGHFDLGMVEPGKYRLLASPDRLFKQPPTLTCQTGDTCKLDIMLEVTPTDTSTYLCPIR
jgi:hypothetical protein